MSDSPSSSSDTEPGVTVEFNPPPGFRIVFDNLHAHEELGRPFLYHLELASDQLKDIAAFIGATVSLTLKQTQEGTKVRYFHAVVTKVVSAGMVNGAYRYRYELRPWIWLLSRVTDCKIFQNKSAFEIITTVFRDAGFSDFEDKRQASSGDLKLEYCVQYHETSLHFVTRLMEEFGIYYFFKHEKNKHTLVLADDPNAHETLPTKIPFSYDQTGPGMAADHIWEWSAARSLETAKVTYQDYNFTTPAADLTAKSMQSPGHPHGDKEIYEYPGPHEQAADGTKLTDVRMQSLGMNRLVTEAVTNARDLRPGWRFNMELHPEDASNRDYLITSAEFSMTMGEGASSTGGESLDTYRTHFHAIPGDVHFRLEPKTRRPMIRGPQTAVVDGESGEEITVDQYGRVKVKFHWDRGTASDNQHTCWIRVAQASAGVNWGSMFIPREGQEVVVEFLEGNPDRPLITGVVYNANVTVPYALPANKTRSTIKTNSSPGGGGFNELRFEDKKGEEEVFFQAQKDYNKKVLNDETVTIHKDTTTTVETGNRKVTVSAGNDTLTVSAGNHTITVSAGKSEVTAAQSITLTVGASSIKIDPSGVTISGAKISIQGSATVAVTAPAISLN